MRKSRLFKDELAILRLFSVTASSYIISACKQNTGMGRMFPGLLLLLAFSATLEHNAHMIEPTYFDAQCLQPLPPISTGLRIDLATAQ